jgi:hypothetical protein
MKKAHFAILTIAAAAIMFGGCSSKSYFEPKQIEGKVDFDSKISSKLVSVNSQGATMENGQFVTKKGMGKFALPKGYEFLSQTGVLVVASNDLGDVIVFDEDGKEVAKHHFDLKVVTAAAKGGKLALIATDNTAVLYDYTTSEVVFKQRNDTAFTVDAKIAAPYFLESLVIFPTFDGKLFIVDINEKRVVRDVVVSSEKNFNNIIFFDIIDDKLVAATPTKVVSINPRNANFLEADIVDIIFVKEGIYVFTKDGKIILTDTDLRVLKEKKFPFARFVGVIHGKYIYAVEKEGYLIATDVNLATSNVFKFSAPFYGMSSTFEGFLFTSGDSIFYDNKQFKLAK